MAKYGVTLFQRAGTILQKALFPVSSIYKKKKKKKKVVISIETKEHVTLRIIVR